MICGNFSAQYGGGIGHFGLSDGGLIQGNNIVSNESFDEGGGIHIGGETPAGASGAHRGRRLGGDQPPTSSRATRPATTAAASAPARSTARMSPSHPTDPTQWYQIDIFNNIIVNNSSADHGGGMSFDDTVKLNVIGNTVARNDSTATGSDAFGGPCTENSPIGQTCPPRRPSAGCPPPFRRSRASRASRTARCCAALPGRDAATRPTTRGASPTRVLMDNIVWQNRSFFWDASANNNLGGLVLASPRPPARRCRRLLGPRGLRRARDVEPDVLDADQRHRRDGVQHQPRRGRSEVPRRLLPPYAPPQAANRAVGSCFNVYQSTSKGSALGNFVTATFTPNGVQGDLTNSGMRERPDLFDPHTVHYHGFPNAASVFDGEPMASFSIGLGESLTYYYNNQYPGTYMWHCHVEAAEHMQMGMLGNLYILPGQDATCATARRRPGQPTASRTRPAPRHWAGFAYNDGDGSTGYDVMYFLQETAFDPAFHDADHTYQKLPFADMVDTLRAC